MNQLQTNSNRNLTDAILNYLWRNWTALGVAGNVEPSKKEIIDPEALLLLTCSVGRCDQRLFDEVIDWLTVNWELVNINRIKNMLKRYQWTGETSLRALSGWLIEHQKKLTKWRSLAEHDEVTEASPFFMNKDGSEVSVFGEIEPVFLKYGFSRGVVSLRGYSRTFQKENPACLLLTLRSFFGTNVRTEIMAYLLTHTNGAHPSGIANEISYYQKSAQNALTAMKNSKWIKCRETGFEKVYSLDPEMRTPFLKEKEEDVKWQNLAPVYCMIEKVWEKTADKDFANLSCGIQSIELKEVVNPLKKDIKHPLFFQFLSEETTGEKYLSSLVSAIMKFTE